MSSVIANLAQLITAIENCKKNGNNEWKLRHERKIQAIERQYLPSGSGIDAGCTVDLNNSTSNKVLLKMSYHHMNDVGVYTQWTDYIVTVRPEFVGLDIRIRGKDLNDIKDYLGDVFHSALSAEIDPAILDHEND